MKIFGYVFLLAMVFLSSCRKKDFPETVPAPQGDFYFNGNVAGSDVSIKAGTNSYYMYSSHSLDNSSLYRFTAELKPAGCIDCKNSIRITINDFKYSVGNELAKIDSSLMPRPYPLLGAPFYAVKFRSIFNKSATSFLWNFGDNSSSVEANPIHLYSSLGNYSVSLKINSDYGCQQYISNIEKINYPGKHVKISSSSTSANEMSFTANTPDSSTSSYLWHFGDGSMSNLATPSHSYSIPGTYPVSVRIINAANDTLYARYNVATQTSPMPCITNYSVESVSQVPNPKPFSTIIIDWTDENGDVYTSNNVLQPKNSYFKILSVEDYDLNERGEKTKKIRVNFSCQVYNGTRTKFINNGEAVVCVSYR